MFAIRIQSVFSLYKYIIYKIAINKHKSVFLIILIKTLFHSLKTQ